MKHKVRLRLIPIIARLEQHTGERLKDNEYAQQIGISRQAFAALLEGETGGAKDATLAKLLDFFTSKGMEVSINDFYEVTQEPLLH